MPNLPIEALELRQLLAAQLFISNASSTTPAHVGEYNVSGSVVNANLINLGSNGYPFGIAVSGSDVFVSNFYTDTVGEYTTSGKTVNAKLISSFPSGTGPFGLAISGSDLYVAVGNGGAAVSDGLIGEYTLGSTPGTIASSKPKLVTGVDDAGSVAVNGSDLFLTDYALGTVDEFTTSGVKIADPLVAGLARPEDVVDVGGDLFVTEYTGDCIGEFDASNGATIKQFLVSGLSGPWGLAASASDLFVNNAGKVSEYTLQGGLVNPSLITGLASPQGVVYVPGTTTDSLAFKTEPTTATVGVPLSPAVSVQILDPNGNPLASSAAVTLSIASGPKGAKIGGTVKVNAVNGLATFKNITLSAAGKYVLKAAEATLSTNSSSSITVTSGAATKLVIGSQPTTATAGKVLSSIKVDVDSASGSIVTGNTSTVTLSIASGPAGAKLAGTLIEKAVKGIAAFSNLSLTLAGKYTFKVIDGNLTAAVTKSITIKPGAVAKLVIAKQPTSGVVGVALSPALVVDLEDSFGNIVTSSTNSAFAALASEPSGAKLTGKTTVKAVAGVLTFSDLILSKAGGYLLDATEGNLAVISRSITVTPPPATKLAIVKQQVTAVAGKAVTPLVVDVETATGAIATTNKTTVTLTLLSGPTGGKVSGKLTATAVNGIATFSGLSFNLVGVYELKATDGSLTAATSKTITVTPGAPAKLVITEQPTSTANDTTPLVVHIEDAFGNLVTSAETQVSLALSSAPKGGALQGTTTVKAVNGIATFSKFILTVKGTYKLKATDGSLTPAVSAPIVVSGSTGK
jgi:hypothetical protein